MRLPRAASTDVETALAMTKRLEDILRERLWGHYKKAFKLALQLADEAKSCQRPDIEIKAIWEAMDAGKVVYPEKRKLLQGLGRRSLGLMRLPRPDSIGARNDIRMSFGDTSPAPADRGSLSTKTYLHGTRSAPCQIAGVVVSCNGQTAYHWRVCREGGSHGG